MIDLREIFPVELNYLSNGACIRELQPKQSRVSSWNVEFIHGSIFEFWVHKIVLEEKENAYIM
jgi:hypothetical protein